jgi:hypothetical protein
MMNFIGQVLNVRLDLDEQAFRFVSFDSVGVLAGLFLLRSVLGFFDDALSPEKEKKCSSTSNLKKIN